MLKSVLVLAVCTTLQVISGVCGGACTRQPPPGTDCSTFDTVCQVEKVNSGGTYQEDMEWPDENTRTCYRTCIEETPSFYDICEATLTGVHNQQLKKDPDNPDYSLQRLFSPNYKDGQNYRKSTVCRYNVKCDVGKQLSYSFHEHNLEDRKMCSGNNECVDSISIDFPNYGNAVQTTCGTEINTSVIYQDGANELTVEFMTNREHQYPGFYMFVWCISPSYGGGYTYKRSTCAVPQTDKENYRKRRTYDQYPFHPRRTALTTPISLVVQTGEWVTYIKNTLIITRTQLETEEVIEKFSGVACFYVYNRISALTVHYKHSSGRFSGYGYLQIVGRNAYFRQEGVNPEDRPTDEEAKLILDLEQGLVKHFEDEYFDVLDELDGAEKYDAIYSPTFDPNEEELDRLHQEEQEQKRIMTSMEYSDACNGQLRAAACAYQEVVLKQDCYTGGTGGTITDGRITTATVQPTAHTKSDVKSP